LNDNQARHNLSTCYPRLLVAKVGFEPASGSETSHKSPHSSCSQTVMHCRAHRKRCLRQSSFCQLYNVNAHSTDSRTDFSIFC
jgi:hypothetical protein